MSKNSELLHKIDKCVAVTSEKVVQLTDRFDDKEDSDERWHGRLEAAAKLCPETEHIKTQNGKIDDMTITLKAVKLLTKVIIILGIVIGAILGVMQYANSQEEYVVQHEIHNIDQILVYMNQSERAAYLDIKFECNNRQAKILILKITTIHKCLACRNCFEYINKTKNDFLGIGDYWYQLFGTHRVDIYNKHGILKCQVLENK